MQIAPIPTLSDEINDIRLRTADIVAYRIIPNEGKIYAGGDKSKKLRKEINVYIFVMGLLDKKVNYKIKEIFRRLLVISRRDTSRDL